MEPEKFEQVLASPIIATQHVRALPHAVQSAPASPLLNPPDDDPLLEDPLLEDPLLEDPLLEDSPLEDSPLEDPPSVALWVEPPPPDELLPHATPATRAARPRRTHIRMAPT